MIEDRRVRKTKHALRVGLADLLSEKSIHQITVKELVDKVDIHRSTFYANFEDIYDLYNHMEDVAIEEISLIVSADLDPTVFSPAAYYEILLKYITDNKQISHLFFSGKVSKTFTNKITELFRTAYYDCLRQGYKIKATDEQLSYYYYYCFSGALAVIEKWVVGEFTCSQEELITMLGNIDKNFEKFVASQFNANL